MRMKKQTIILAAAVMTLFLIGSVFSNAPEAFAKTSHHNSKGNASTPSNHTSSNNNGNSTALSLSNPALNNLQPPGGSGQNNTTTKTLPGLVNLAPGRGQNNTNPPNQETTKTLPGLTQLVPAGQNNGNPTNNTSPPVKIIKLPPGIRNPVLGNLTVNPNPGTNTNSTGTNGNNSTGTNGNNSTGTNGNNNTNTNTNVNNNTNINTNTNANTNTNTNTIINQNTIQNTVKINNEVNNIIRATSQTTAATITTTSPSSKGPLVVLETVKLGKSTFPSAGIRPLGDVSPFQIIGGHVSLNSPSPNVYVIVAQITDKGVQHAVIVDLKKTASGIPGETLYHTDLGQTITGTNPFTGKGDTMSHITDLLLYNNNKSSVQFNDDSELTMTIIFR